MRDIGQKLEEETRGEECIKSGKGITVEGKAKTKKYLGRDDRSREGSREI